MADARLSEAGGMEAKRRLAFVAAFVGHSGAALNAVGAAAQRQLTHLDAKLQRLDAALTVLEANLASIPGLEGAPAAPPASQPPPEAAVAPAQPEEVPQEEAPLAPAAEPDPQVARFVRMVAVGVPLEAVRLKMRSEGLDPDLLNSADVKTAKRVAASHSSSSEDSD